MSTQTINVGSIQQLIDLNNESVNFEASFTVDCPDGNNFSMLVVDQETLDSGEYTFKEVTTGNISGKVEYNQNRYLSHYIILKSVDPCKVNVTINKVELPEVPVQGFPEVPVTERFGTDESSGHSNQSINQPNPAMLVGAPLNEGISTFKIVAIVVVIVIGAAVLYYMYTRKKSKDDSVDGSSGESSDRTDINSSRMSYDGSSHSSDRKSSRRSEKSSHSTSSHKSTDSGDSDPRHNFTPTQSYTSPAPPTGLLARLRRHAEH
jgi:hypothetical protein